MYHAATNGVEQAILGSSNFTVRGLGLGNGDHNIELNLIVDGTPASFLEDLIDACVMECYFREHMAELDLLFHDTLAPDLAAYAPEASETQQRDFLTHLHLALNAPSHPIRNRLLRLTADSPDLLAVIKQEGKV